MLRKYEQLRISEYSSLYDLIVTENNFLRRIKDNIVVYNLKTLIKKKKKEQFISVK